MTMVASAHRLLQLFTPRVLPSLGLTQRRVCGRIVVCALRRRLSRLRADCSVALRTMRMPSNRQEEFRYTDLSPILKAQIQASASALNDHASPVLSIVTRAFRACVTPACLVCLSPVWCLLQSPLTSNADRQVLTDDMTESAALAAIGRHPLDEAAGCRVVVRNGVVDRDLTDLSSLPDGVFVGSLADAPAEAGAQLVRSPACA